MSTDKERPADPQPRAGELEDPKSLETRFGLVMYGGVSLAIYINGVAREFFRAVRGAGVYKLIKALTDRDVVVDVISGTSAGGINGIMLGYALCNKKDFASCASLWRLDGDVRSLLRSPHGGADAAESLFDSETYYQPRLEAAFREMPEYVEEEGEINSEFKELDLFVTGTDVDGNISTQFDDAGHPIDVKDHRSLFLLKHRQGRKHPFEPGSSLGGVTTPQATYEALAKLARITSCFPAAFTPVHVSGSEPAGNATADGKLQLWGGLGKDSCFLDGGVIDNKPFTYTIGEIFGRSADRVVERKLFYVEPDPEHFQRPERASRPNFVQAVIASLIGIPGYESIADDLRLLAQHNTKVQQYRRLRRHLEERARASEAPAPAPSQQDRALYDRCSLVALSERMIEGILKVNGRAELLSRKDRTAAAALIEAFDKVQDEAARGELPVFVRNFNVYFRLRRLYHTVYKIVEVLGKIERVAENEGEIDRLTNLWRVLNGEIELLDIVRGHMERLIDDAPISWKDRLGEPAGAGDEPSPATIGEARVVWDVVTEGLHRLIDRRGRAAGLMRDAFNGVREEIKALGDGPGGRLEGFGREALSAFNKALREKAQEIISDINDDKIRRWVTENREALEGRSVSFRSILQLARMFEEDVIAALLPEGGEGGAAGHRAEVRAAYVDFSSYDAQLFPIEFVAGLYEKDVIETIRISPLDAERGFSNKGLSDKVSGDALYHFAGFFKRSWRSNDILWGRLDSLCQLTETLLTPEKIERVLKSELLLERARKRFFTAAPGEPGPEPGKENTAPWIPAMHPARLFPHAGKPTQDDLAEWLVGLLWREPGGAPGEGAQGETQGEPKKEPLMDREDFVKKKLARIIEAAQLEVIYEDLPGVITDALEEQARWNQFRYPSDLLKSGVRAPEAAEGDGGGTRYDPTSFPPVYIPSQGRLDAFASVIAAAGAASDAMKHLEKRPAAGTTPMDTGVGQFFSRDYRIGSEALLRDLPPLVLLEIVSTTLLVVRNCVLKVLGRQAERIKSQPLYVFGVDFPLRAFNTLVLFLRRVPGARTYLPILLGLLSALLLFIGVMWKEPIVWTKDTGLHPLWFALFIAGPLTLLTAEAVYLYRGKVDDLSWLRGARDLLFALALLFPMLVVIVAYGELYAAAKGAVQLLYGGWFRAVNGWARGGLDFMEGSGGSALLARYSVLAAIALTFLGPLFAFALIARSVQRRSPDSDKLRESLKSHFSVPEMLAVARRLGLPRYETLEGIAMKHGVFGEDELLRASGAVRRRLGEFREELLRKLGLSGGDAYKAAGERVEGERRVIQFDELIRCFNEVEMERKRRAYENLEKMTGYLGRWRQREQLAAAEAAGAGAADLTAAVEKLVACERAYQRLKQDLAYRSIENASQTRAALLAGADLAASIVEAALAHDRAGTGLYDRAAARLRRRRPDPLRKKAPEKKLAQLEDIMYSINPGVMG